VPSVGFEPAIPVFERPKIVHVSDRAATVTGETRITASEICLRARHRHMHEQTVCFQHATGTKTTGRPFRTVAYDVHRIFRRVLNKDTV
jgi:hypothetical protein